MYSSMYASMFLISIIKKFMFLLQFFSVADVPVIEDTDDANMPWQERKLPAYIALNKSPAQLTARKQGEAFMTFRH